MKYLAIILTLFLFSCSNQETLNEYYYELEESIDYDSQIDSIYKLYWGSIDIDTMSNEDIIEQSFEYGSSYGSYGMEKDLNYEIEKINKWYEGKYEELDSLYSHYDWVDSSEWIKWDSSITDTFNIKGSHVNTVEIFILALTIIVVFIFAKYLFSNLFNV